MNISFDFSGKMILVTGASSGIGREASILCAAAGATVFLVGRNEARLKETRGILSGGGHQYFCGDIKGHEFILDICKQVPPLDGVIHSAGLMKLMPLKFITSEMLGELLATNLAAPILFTSMLAKEKKMRPLSSIVLLSSVMGTMVGSKANSVYAATKGALQAFCKSAALELSLQQVRINCIAPGMVDTGGITAIAEQVSPESIKADQNKYPLGRYGTTKEIASACLFLLSDASGWTTGSTMIVDGGFTIQ